MQKGTYQIIIKNTKSCDIYDVESYFYGNVTSTLKTNKHFFFKKKQNVIMLT